MGRKQARRQVPETSAVEEQNGDQEATGASAPDGDSAQATGHREATVVVADEDTIESLLGARDVVLRALETALEADIHVRGNRITLRGSAKDVAFAEHAVRELVELQKTGAVITPDTVRRTIGILVEPSVGAVDDAPAPSEVLGLNIISRRGRSIRPKSVNQKRYVDAINTHTVVFGIGPAGTGKTYLAMAKAVQALQTKQVSRIILTRPAVEAGERLGFLPGTLSEKIDPYLRPLYDALHDMIDPDTIPRLMAAGTIEVAPLAYMRGRTLNDAFIVLDEAQNTTAEQMKMFLTRLGFGSNMVVTGDVTQIDLHGGQMSGLRIVSEILSGIDDVAFMRLTSADVVRHRLVGEIVDAYEKWDAIVAAEEAAADSDRDGRGAGGGGAGGARRHSDRDSRHFDRHPREAGGHR